MNQIISTIPRLYSGIAQWAGCMVYLLAYYRRMRGSVMRFALISAAALVALCLEMVCTEGLQDALWVVAMVSAVGLMYLFFLTASNLSPLSAAYCCVRAFVLSELAASVEWQLFFYYRGGEVNQSGPLRFGFMVAVFAVVFAIGFLLERSVTREGTGAEVKLNEFLAVLFIGVAVFFISNLSFVSSATPFSASEAMDIYNVRTFVDLGGMAVLFAYHMLHRELHARYEAQTIQSVLETHYDQFKMNRESIEIINRKYHDLKHQLAAIRADTDAERRHAWLDEIESEIADYEAQNKTGNPVLDTVLTGKSLYCQKHHITLTSVVDGTLVNFMDAMDICTIFGNALDNAIEAVREIEDFDKRLIHLTVSAQRGFVLIHAENYYEGELKFADGAPVSTKGDLQFHGFGFKRILYTAERYGGTVTATAEENWFDLRVLLPQS